MIQKVAIIVIFTWSFTISSAGANNISVTEVILTAQNTITNRCIIQFNISWENSWRSTYPLSNWDAAYVFIKYRVPTESGGDGIWKHSWLNQSGNIAPSGSSISSALLDPGNSYNQVTNPAIGAFIYRSFPGTGTFSKIGVQLIWNYGTNYKSGTIPIGDNDIIDIRVFAIEMVYIPGGSFSLGSGGIGTSEFYKYPSTNASYTVNDEKQIVIDNKNNKLYYSSSAYGGDRSGPVPDAFSKGYNAFYCMKYEINQQSYTDFLNTLTYVQQVSRSPISPSSSSGTYFHNLNRNKIYVCIPGLASNTPAVYATDYPSVSCNYMSWSDIAAWLDWSGLRPMTEMEFEKICRGNASPVAGEYAWGTNTIANNHYTVNNPGNSNEYIGSNYSTIVGNASYVATTPVEATVYGPLRTGIFAGTSGNTGRVSSGSGIYGIMELSGNLGERVITIGNSKGRSFAGIHGNGLLNLSGNSDINNWPGEDAIGCGLRGGDWKSNAFNLAVSDRAYATYTFNGRNEKFGGRGVRSAP